MARGLGRSRATWAERGPSKGRRVQPGSDARLCQPRRSVRAGVPTEPGAGAGGCKAGCCRLLVCFNA